MENQRIIHILSSRIDEDISELRQLTDMSELYLKKEAGRLEKRVSRELKALSSEEEKDYMTGWYTDEFVRLDKVYPNIQRRSLFITLMCMAEADLLFACESCRRAFRIRGKFKKKGNRRVIEQALSYLCKNLTIRERTIKPYWESLQDLWSIRNALVHSDGKPKGSELQKISEFSAPIPTLELDNENRVIIKEGGVHMALHQVHLFFSRLLEEIKKNKLPNNSVEEDRAT
jgi:hypothetical protein